MNAKLLKRERIGELMDVYPEEGKFIWRPREITHWTVGGWNKWYAGKEAGSLNADGYIVVNVDKKVFLAHRLMWFYVHGEWPKEIDHINGDRTDFKISNLRSVTRLQNRRNAGKNKNNKSGTTGVCWDSKRSQWIAYIWNKRKFHWLGGFDDISDAIAIRKVAEVKFGYHPNHGREAPLP